MISGSKGHAFHACMKKAWLILTRKHRKVAFFRRKWTNLRCFRIARAWNAKQSVYHRNQNIFWPQHHLITLTKSSCKATIRLWDILRSDPVTDVFPMLLQVAGIIKTDIVHHPYCFFLLWWLQQDLSLIHIFTWNMPWCWGQKVFCPSLWYTDFFSSSLQFIQITCEAVDMILSPVAPCHSSNSFFKILLTRSILRIYTKQIAKRLRSWASSEARPCQQSCRDGLWMSALHEEMLIWVANKMFHVKHSRFMCVCLFLFPS